MAHVSITKDALEVLIYSFQPILSYSFHQSCLNVIGILSFIAVMEAVSV